MTVDNGWLSYSHFSLADGAWPEMRIHRFAARHKAPHQLPSSHIIHQLLQGAHLDPRSLGHSFLEKKQAENYRPKWLKLEKMNQH